MVGALDTERPWAYTTKHEDGFQICRSLFLRTLLLVVHWFLTSGQPMAWPDRISVYHKLRTAPTASTDSFILDVLILSERHQRPAARCVEDIVVYDYRRGTKSPLKDFMVEEFKKTFELQEQSRIRNEQRVSDLLQRIQRLEQQSWDRPDAVEDRGNA